MQQRGSRGLWVWTGVWLALLTLAGCSGGGGSGPAPSQQTQPSLTLVLGDPAAQPAVIPPSGEATPVTFLSLLSGSAPPPAALLLDEVDANGQLINAAIAPLRDDGELTDQERGDRMYSGSLMLSSLTAAEKYYRVRAEHNGATLLSGVLNFWVSGCPATARPSDPAQAVQDTRGNSLIFANEVMIQTAPGVAPDLDPINQIAATVNGRVVGCIPALRHYLLEIDSDGSAEGVYAAIDTLLTHADIASAFPNAQAIAPSPSPGDTSLLCGGEVTPDCQWYLERIRARQAWALAGGGDPQRGVAVIDFGVDCTRGDLDCDSTLYNTDPIDHGTGVAGLIGSRQNPTGMVGVAWNTRLYPYSFLGQAGSQYKLNELITAALGQSEVRVINISAGTRSDYDGQIKAALCTAIGSG
ncbi:MAG TPA: S8/S53 family peptidase, partial [Gammaproteobacteria bacterium]